MFLMFLSIVPAHGFGSRVDCWPVSKQLATQVVRTPMNAGGILVVVEESVCDAAWNAPVVDPPPVVPQELRREPTFAEETAARVEGRDLARLGPTDLVPTVAAVVSSVAERLPSVPPARVTTDPNAVIRVVAGDATFLDQLVDVAPTGCSWAASGAPWTIHTAQYCVLDQVGEREGTAFPRPAFPGWAADMPNEVREDDVPLIDALVDIYTVNGVQPLAFFFLGSPGEPDGLPRRRISVEVHYARLPEVRDSEHTIRDREPGAPPKVFREIPGDTDEPHNPVPK